MLTEEEKALGSLLRMRLTSGVLGFDFIIDRGDARDAEAGRNQAKAENEIEAALCRLLHMYFPQKDLGNDRSGDVDHTGKDYIRISNCEVDHNKGSILVNLTSIDLVGDD